MEAQTDFDVGIIGGGPAGAALGAYLGKAGVSCVVLERELFPRPHVGESLVPSSTRIFAELDFLKVMEAEKFPHKFGGVWTAPGSSKVYSHDWKGFEANAYADLRFSERDQPGVGQAYTYHVDRAKFDVLLLQHANKLGAEVYEGVDVRGIERSDDRVDLVYAMGRRTCRTSVKMVVDASGRRTLVGNQLKWKVRDTVFDQYALHTWFENFDRSVAAETSAKLDYIYIHFLPISNSWIWQIPITETITSVGVVTQKKNFAKTKESREQFFWDCISSRPELFEALKRSAQLRPLTDEGDYSYSMTKIIDDRVVLIGDAARFVDPIFSTGVSIALTGARLSSWDIVKAVESGSYSVDAFREYESTMRRGTTNWYEFIRCYYRLNVLFTAFVRDPRTRLDVLKLVQGDVYDELDPPVLQKMRSIVSEVERNPNHIWHKQLGDLTSDALRATF